MNSGKGVDDIISKINKAQIRKKNSNDKSMKIIDLDENENSLSKKLSSESLQGEEKSISSIFPKRKSLENIEKEKAIDPPKFDKFFGGFNFLFIPAGLTLTKKRTELLADIVQKRGATVSSLANFFWTQKLNTESIIISSFDLSIDVLTKLIPPIHHSEIQNYLYLSCEWITECVKRNNIIDKREYYIRIPGSKYCEEIIKESSTSKPEKDYLLKDNEANQVGKKLKKINSEDDPFVISEDENEDKETEGSENRVKKSILADMDYVEFKKYKRALRLSHDKEVMEKYRYLYDYDYGLPGKNIEVLIEQDDQLSAKTFDSDNEIPSQIGDTSPLMKREFNKSNSFNSDSNFKDDHDVKQENKMTKREHVKEEGNIKKEIKSENNFIYVLDDDDDEVSVLQNEKKKKLKFESQDLEGTLIEGIQSFDMVNTTLDGALSEMREFKVYNPMIKSRGQYVDKKKEFFVCQSGVKENNNKHLTEPLEKIMKAYESFKDKGRRYITSLNVMLSHGYRRVISALKSFPKKITSVDEVEKIYGIGKKMKDKIKEILSTGTLRKAEALENDEQAKVIELFDSIWGVGIETALKLYQKGFRTLEDLRKNTHLLNDWQKIGLKYHEEFEQRIPRDDVTEIYEIVKAKTEELSDIKGIYEAICCGSYRRGKATCGDIDILFTRKDMNSFEKFLSTLIKSLEGTLLTDHLSWPHTTTYGHQSYMGVCLFKNVHRRIDFKIYPREQFGYAVLYFTGSDHFNRSMRLFAKRKGMNLEDHGLYPALRTKEEKVRLQNIPCFTEEDVFRVLGLDYKAPNERDV